MSELVAPRKFLGQGIFRVPAEVYHSDPCEQPSLSRSIGVEMITKTPRHGWLKHPRLGGAKSDRKKSRKMDVGSIAHAIITGEGRGVHVITALNKAGDPVDTYATNAAKDERDDALERGLIPALVCDFERAEKMVAATRAALRETPGCEGVFDPTAGGGGEVSVIWKDPIGIWGRAMLDWYGPTPEDVWDFKTTGVGKLSDRDLENRIMDGLHMQEFWYLRGLSIVKPGLAGRLRFNLVFVEDDEPYEVRVVRCTARQSWLGARMMITAAVMFERGLTEGLWPGYRRQIGSTNDSPWHETRWLSREISDPLIQELGSKLLLALSPFAPLD